MPQEPFYSEDEQIARFHEWLMSNVRWRDFFLTTASLELYCSEWTWVSGNRIEIDRMTFEQDLWETRLADAHFQPTRTSTSSASSYREATSRIRGLVREQDVDGLIEALSRTGQKFPF